MSKIWGHAGCISSTRSVSSIAPGITCKDWTWFLVTCMRTLRTKQRHHNSHVCELLASPRYVHTLLFRSLSEAISNLCCAASPNQFSPRTVRPTCLVPNTSTLIQIAGTCRQEKHAGCMASLFDPHPWTRMLPSQRIKCPHLESLGVSRMYHVHGKSHCGNIFHCLTICNTKQRMLSVNDLSRDAV